MHSPDGALSKYIVLTLGRRVCSLDSKVIYTVVYARQTNTKHQVLIVADFACSVLPIAGRPATIK